MNIALFASAFYPHVGGVEEHVRNVAHLFQERGHRPIILTNRWPRSLPKFEVFEGLPVHRLALRVPDGSLKTHVNYRLTHSIIRREMLSILRGHRTEMLHIHCVSANAYYALIAKRILGLPLVASTHGERTMDATRLFERSRFMNGVLRAVLNEADYLTACSLHTLDDMAEYLGRPLGIPSRAVYNGINLAEFSPHCAPPHPRPYILGIGD